MFVLLIVTAGGLLRLCAMRVNIYVCMSYRISDEEFYRGFLKLRAFPLLGIWFAGGRIGIFSWIIVEALVLPKFFLRLSASKLEFDFCWRILFSRLIRLWRNALLMNRPLPIRRTPQYYGGLLPDIFTVWPGRVLQGRYIYTFSRFQVFL